MAKTKIAKTPEDKNKAITRAEDRVRACENQLDAAKEVVKEKKAALDVAMTAMRDTIRDVPQGEMAFDDKD